MENKRQHLALIQNVINRLAISSFFMKGFTVILVSVDFATANVMFSLIPTLVFWGLDGYYLNQERLFRRLYDEVRVRDEGKIDFSMSTAPFNHRDWRKSLFSRTLWAFYGVMLLVIVLMILQAVLFTIAVEGQFRELPQL